MIAGDVQLTRAYTAGSGTLEVNGLADVLASLELPPTRATVYDRTSYGGSSELSTTFRITSIGGGWINLGSVLSGADRAYRTGDLVLLTSSLADATAGGSSLPSGTAGQVLITNGTTPAFSSLIEVHTATSPNATGVGSAVFCGGGATADGTNASAMSGAEADGIRSHADSSGYASGTNAHADSSGQASGTNSHGDSRGNASTLNSHADSSGIASDSGGDAHADSSGIASGSGGKSHADSSGTTSSSLDSCHADSSGIVSGASIAAHADSSGTASATNAHADSSGTASATSAHADSSGTASGIGSHADSSGTASATGSHAQGPGSVADLYGKHAQAAGWLTTPGDAQHGRVVMKGATADATPTNLTIGSSLLLIRANMAYGFVASITARKDDGSKLGRFIRNGLISNLAGTTALSGSVGTLGTDINANGWAVAITADNTNDCLQVQVTGEAATTIHWVCSVVTEEVG